MVQVITNDTNRLSALNYPKLMISKDLQIVLFKENRVGVVVRQIFESKPIGFYSEFWLMELFTDFNESITLQNELP